MIVLYCIFFFLRCTEFTGYQPQHEHSYQLVSISKNWKTDASLVYLVVKSALQLYSECTTKNILKKLNRVIEYLLIFFKQCAQMVYLLRHLAKVAYVSKHSAFHYRILHARSVVFVSVEIWVKGVEGLHCGRTLLFVSEDQINPKMQECTHVIALKSLQRWANSVSQQIWMGAYTLSVMP